MRVLCFTLAPIVVLAYLALSIALTVIEWKSWHGYDIVWMNLLGLLFGFVVWRVGSIEARPSPDGLTVRNIFSTQFYEWNQIIDAHLPLSSSRAVLDLNDGTTTSVMAIQHSDAGRARSEINRLRTLIETNTKGEQ